MNTTSKLLGILLTTQLLVASSEFFIPPIIFFVGLYYGNGFFLSLVFGVAAVYLLETINHFTGATLAVVALSTEGFSIIESIQLITLSVFGYLGWITTSTIISTLILNHYFRLGDVIATAGGIALFLAINGLVIPYVTYIFGSNAGEKSAAEDCNSNASD